MSIVFLPGVVLAEEVLSVKKPNEGYMKYDKGNLILSEEERELLVFATLNKIDAQYPAPYFVGSLAEIRVEAEARIRLLQSKQDPVECDQQRISVLRKLIDIIDWMIEQGFDAAEAAGATIKLQ